MDDFIKYSIYYYAKINAFQHCSIRSLSLTPTKQFTNKVTRKSMLNFCHLIIETGVAVLGLKS